MSYWIYQHIGNLSPRELDENELYARVRGNPDATEVLREWAHEIDIDRRPGTRWSFYRDIGGVRAIFVDSRAARVLTEERRAICRRRGVGLDRRARRGRLRPPADRRPPSPSCSRPASTTSRPGTSGSATAPGAAWPRAPSEQLRRAVDFDHWAAFQYSFGRLRELLEEVGSGRRGKAPASIVVLSGDVHHAYLCEVEFDPERRGREPRSTRRSARPTATRSTGKSGGWCGPASRARSAAIARGLARLAGAPDPGIRWRTLEGPYFDNQVATLRLDGREASMRLDKTVAGEEDQSALEKTFERRLT